VANLFKDNRRLSGCKGEVLGGEVLEEVYRDTETWIGWAQGFQTDDLPLSFQIRDTVDIQGRLGGLDGEGKDLAELEWRIMMQVEIAPRQADIPNNPIPLMYFTTSRIPSLIMNRQRDEKTIVPSSFHGREHITLSEATRRAWFRTMKRLFPRIRSETCWLCVVGFLIPFRSPQKVKIPLI
jgi:hypothetical protein